MDNKKHKYVAIWRMNAVGSHCCGCCRRLTIHGEEILIWSVEIKRDAEILPGIRSRQASALSNPLPPLETTTQEMCWQTGIYSI